MKVPKNTGHIENHFSIILYCIFYSYTHINAGAYILIVCFSLLIKMLFVILFETNKHTQAE